MSYPMHTAIEAEVAYRRERLLGQFRRSRQGRQSVGSVRQTRRVDPTATPTASHPISVSR